MVPCWVVPSANTSASRPTQTHVPANRCRCSQASTSGAVYARAGSILDSPNGRITLSSSSNDSGAVGHCVI
jgi:hypothetical protein